MAARRATRRGPSRPAAAVEWVGGRLRPPFFITDRAEPYRPAMVFWIAEPSGRVVANDVVALEDAPGALGRALAAALATTGGDALLRPSRIRVATAEEAEEARAVVGGDIPVVSGPTPEIGELLESLLASMPESDVPQTYLEGGRVPEPAVAALFRNAACLHAMAPWKADTEGALVRMDIPAFGVDGACVAIIGHLGESLGLLIFPSLDAYDAFGRASERCEAGRQLQDLGSDWLSLTFERGADLPPALRREVKRHGWPVANARAYPRVEAYERDGAVRPLVERDVRVAAACASAFAVFYAKHRALFVAEEIEPVCESYFDEDELEVRLTLPYEAFPLFDVAPAAAPPARPRVGRNEPCPCGSGRKYKKCCLPGDEAAASARRGRDSAHDLDEHWVVELEAWAFARFGDQARAWTRQFKDARDARPLAAPWSVYGDAVRGRPIVDWYLEEHGRRLRRADRAWLEAQRAAWLSVWEVLAAEPGEALVLRDLLTEETRRVREVLGSTMLVARDAILARVVDHDGVSLLCGTHPRPLPPRSAAAVAERARACLRLERAVPPERLRAGDFGRTLIRLWEEAVVALDPSPRRATALVNSDGHRMLFTSDHFELAPGSRDAVAAALRGLEGAQLGATGADATELVFLAPGAAGIVVGHARLAGQQLVLETNSRERGDALLARVEAACGVHLRHRTREHADPLSSRGSRPGARLPTPQSDAEVRQLVLDLEERH